MIDALQKIYAGVRAIVDETVGLYLEPQISSGGWMFAANKDDLWISLSITSLDDDPEFYGREINRSMHEMLNFRG